MQSPLSRIPIIRILFPFAIGILISYYIEITHIVSWIIFTFGITAAITLEIVSRRNAIISYQLRHIHIIPFFIIATAAGILITNFQKPQIVDLRKINGSIISGVISDLRYNEKSMSMNLSCPQIGLVHITTRNCNYNLQEGDIIAFRADLAMVKNWGNPNEFNYKGYLYDKGIIYSQHISAKRIKIIGHSEKFIYKIINFRYGIEKKILFTRLNPPTKYFIIAILLGNSNYIDRNTRDEFSKSGASHILALSGLHISIITLIIWFLLFPLDYLSLKRFRLLITIVIISSYAIFSGMSPSVLRSCIMVSFCLFAHILYRKGAKKNSLFAAALIILSASPFSLFHVGFQLSFACVLVLIVISDKILPKYKIKNTIIKYIITSFTTSFAAVLATAAITAYYFHIIPTLSLITNLIILPLLPAFMIIALIYIFFLCLDIEWKIFNNIIEAFYSLIKTLTHTISQYEFAYIDNIYISPTIAILSILSLLILCIWIYYHKKIFLFIILGNTILVSVFYTNESKHIPNEGLVIFNSYNSTPILYFKDRIGYLWCPTDDLSTHEFSNHYKEFLIFNKIDSIVPIIEKTKIGKNLFMSPYASILGHNFVIIGSGKWKHYRVKEKIDVDYMIITNAFHSNINTLFELYNTKNIILSGDIYEKNYITLCHDLESNNIKYISLRESGAISVFR